MAADDVSQLIADLCLDGDMEVIGGEIIALQAIYGEDSLELWQASESGIRSQQNTGTKSIRFQVTAKLPDYDAVSIRCLVSLPSSYPDSSPPQLQLLSKYVGVFQVDPVLFGAVLRTYLSSEGIQWTSGQICVFDGLENVISRCSDWYKERLSEKAGAELRREVLKTKLEDSSNSTEFEQPTVLHRAITPILEVEIHEGVPIQDRKSVFIGRACRISDPAQVPQILSFLMLEHRIAKAAHPIINAWRCEVNDIIHADNDDNGETAAGGRLAHLLEILELCDVLVVVTRYFGGIHLGPDRFKHINQSARNALEKGGFLGTDDEERGGNRAKKRAKAQGTHKK